MREIRFRGKCMEMGKWVYGNLIKQFDIVDRLLKYYYIESYTGEEINLVEPKTIGQFTGLEDKNGREIYEGDIVGDSNESYIVHYNTKTLSFDLKDFDELNQCPLYYFSKCKVIGNIHEKKR